MYLSIWHSAWYLLSPQWAFVVIATIILTIQQGLAKQVAPGQAEGMEKAYQNPDINVSRLGKNARTHFQDQGHVVQKQDYICSENITRFIKQLDKCTKSKSNNAY